MAQTWTNLAWFYRGKAEQQFGASESLEHKFLYTVLSICTLTGFLYCFSWVFQFTRLIFSLFILPGKSLRTFGPPSKTWAVVTGASDGIGKEFSLYLARAGYSIVLVSRTASKLDAVAAEIKQKYGTPTLTYALDFSIPPSSDGSKQRWDGLASLLQPLDIGILINNVGQSHSIPVSFHETPLQEMDNIITTNNLSTLHLTHLVTNLMLSRKKPALILTMGSFAGLLPTALLATYSGSKAFLQHWSTALGTELAPHNITVELVQSYLVTSSMSKIRKPTMMVPTPRQFVRAVMGKIGRKGGAQGWAYTSTPFWSHAVFQWALLSVLSVGDEWVARFNKGFHESIRKRALKKAERDRVKAGGGKKLE